LNRSNLSGSEAIVSVPAVAAHVVLQIDGGIELAAWGIVKDAVRDTVGGVALVQHGTLQDAHFGEALRRPVAVAVEREVPRQVVSKNALRRPHV
jgi:hypothetical protein